MWSAENIQTNENSHRKINWERKKRINVHLNTFGAFQMHFSHQPEFWIYAHNSAMSKCIGLVNFFLPLFTHIPCPTRSFLIIWNEHFKESQTTIFAARMQNEILFHSIVMQFKLYIRIQCKRRRPSTTYKFTAQTKQQQEYRRNQLKTLEKYCKEDIHKMQ